MKDLNLWPKIYMKKNVTPKLKTMDCRMFTRNVDSVTHCEQWALHHIHVDWSLPSLGLVSHGTHLEAKL